MRRFLKVIAGGAVGGLIAGGLQRVLGRRRAEDDAPVDLLSDAEPVLGYDGMDLQTVVPWLESANLDRATLRRIRAYEERRQRRETVLQTIDALLG